MHGSRVDRIAQHLAQGQLSRRAALQASGLSAVAALVRRGGLVAPGVDAAGVRVRVVATPAGQSTPGTCPGASETEVFTDGAWLCRQPYALWHHGPMRAVHQRRYDRDLQLCRARRLLHWLHNLP